MHCIWPKYCEKDSSLAEDDLYAIVDEFLPSLKHGFNEECFDSSWKLHSSVGKTFVYDQRNEEKGIYSVIAVAEMRGSIRELLDVLSCDTPSSFNASMANFLGERFLSGSILHRSAKTNDNVESITLKKASFRNPFPFFGRNEDMLFVDYVECESDGNSAIRLMKSIDNDESPSFYHGKALDRMKGFLAGYRISKCAKKDMSRVLFYVSHFYSPPYRIKKRSLSLKKKFQLQYMASSLRRLKCIIVQRRLGRQTFMRNLVHPKKGMTCDKCTRKFSLLRQGYQCRVCGCFACSDCSKSKIAELSTLEKKRVRVCADCIQRIHSCSYDEVKRSPRIVPELDSPKSITNSSDSQMSLEDLTSNLVKLTKSQDPAVREASQKLLERMGKSENMPAESNSTKDDELIGPEGSIQLDELSVDDCQLLEEDSLRSYPLDFEWDNEFPKPPIIENDDQRVAKLVMCAILDTPNEPLYDIACETAATQLDCPLAAIALVASKRIFLKATYGFSGVSEIPRDCSICTYTITSFSPFMIPNCTSDLRFCNNPLVTGDMGLRFYLGFPLVTADEQVLGTICVMDRKPRAQITTKQYAIMRKLAQSIAHFIDKRMVLPIGRQSEQPEDDETCGSGNYLSF